MSSIKEIEANRLNAHKSTGPRTPRGKAVSRGNALKSAALKALTGEYFEHFQPATPEQRALVDTLIRSDWLLRWLRLTETQIWESELKESQESDYPLALAFISQRGVFARLQRCIDSAGRSYYRALQALRRLQAEAPAEPVPRSTDFKGTSPQDGFGPQLSENPAAGVRSRGNIWIAKRERPQ